MSGRTTSEQDQAERELPAFDARTVIDDIIGKLMFIRGRLFMDVPDGLLGKLHDAEEATERALELVEELPEAPSASRHWLRESNSKCMGEGCSCGMPSWDWTREGQHA